jgi:hypothetical protein
MQCWRKPAAAREECHREAERRFLRCVERLPRLCSLPAALLGKTDRLPSQNPARRDLPPSRRASQQTRASVGTADPADRSADVSARIMCWRSTPRFGPPRLAKSSSIAPLLQVSRLPDTCYRASAGWCGPTQMIPVAHHEWPPTGNWRMNA